jgi:hypothetical protein
MQLGGVDLYEDAELELDENGQPIYYDDVYDDDSFGDGFVSHDLATSGDSPPDYFHAVQDVTVVGTDPHHTAKAMSKKIKRPTTASPGGLDDLTECDSELSSEAPLSSSLSSSPSASSESSFSSAAASPSLIRTSPMSSDEDLSYRSDGASSSASERSTNSGYSTPESDYLMSSSVSSSAARAAAANKSQRSSPCVCERYGITRDGRRVKLDCRGLRCGAYGKRHMSISGHSDGGHSSSSSRSGSPNSCTGMVGGSSSGSSTSGSSSDSASSSGEDPGSSCSSAESDDDEDMSLSAAAAAKGLKIGAVTAAGRLAGDKLGLQSLDMTAAAAAVAAAAAAADPMVSPLAARRHAIYLS